jgi:hypothetical protein
MEQAYEGVQEINRLGRGNGPMAPRVKPNLRSERRICEDCSGAVRRSGGRTVSLRMLRSYRFGALGGLLPDLTVASAQANRRQRIRGSRQRARATIAVALLSVYG